MGAVLDGLAGQVLPPWRKSSAGGNRTCIRRAYPRQRYHAALVDNDMTLCLSSIHAIPVSNRLGGRDPRVVDMSGGT